MRKRIVISTEAAHSFIVRCAVEKPPHLYLPLLVPVVNHNCYSATSIIFAQSTFVPASVFALTGRISSTSCAFFSAATDFAN
jgi:hypothetical protein